MKEKTSLPVIQQEWIMMDRHMTMVSIRINWHCSSGRKNMPGSRPRRIRPRRTGRRKWTSSESSLSGRSSRQQKQQHGQRQKAGVQVRKKIKKTRGQDFFRGRPESIMIWPQGTLHSYRPMKRLWSREKRETSHSRKRCKRCAKQELMQMR